MFTKCVEMVKAFRSHPSVIEYCLQNEIGADLKNPDTIAVLEAMRKEDPEPVHRAERWVCGASAQGGAGLVRAVERQAAPQR